MSEVTSHDQLMNEMIGSDRTLPPFLWFVYIISFPVVCSSFCHFASSPSVFLVVVLAEVKLSTATATATATDSFE